MSNGSDLCKKTGKNFYESYQIFGKEYPGKKEKLEKEKKKEKEAAANK